MKFDEKEIEDLVSVSTRSFHSFIQVFFPKNEIILVN